MIDPRLLDYQDIINRLSPDSRGEYNIALLIAILGISRDSACESDVNYIESVRKIMRDLGYVGKFQSMLDVISHARP